MDSETFRAIQIFALQAVADPTYEDFYRSVCRWYSEKFSTPLHQVEEMADEYVLRHYYEFTYSEVKDSNNEKAEENFAMLKAAVLQTDSEKTEEEMDDDAWTKEIEAELAKQTSTAMSKAMEEIDQHIKQVQQGGEAFEGFEPDELDEDDEIN